MTYSMNGYELGTLEELLQDSFVGFRNRMERNIAELSEQVKQEQ